GGGDNLPACRQRIGTRREGGTVTIEPFRSAVMPVVKDLVVDRCALDFLQGEAGASAAATGRTPDADAVPVARDAAERALDLGACIGCGSCVAACPNGSAALYAGARLASLALAPIPAKQRRARARARAVEIFGPCSGYGECALVCPAGIPLAVTGFVTRERWGALFAGEDE
ncbi:MAG: 4Fe-4S dicluster domain-containing protein, partial [Schaalia hyovaginalis]|uniref:4Fe-4S dicluster domain-containing protein n=1 Tax=Schaalia hyovaginalis TaxID=29316 RepID=UPI002A917624